MIKLRVRERPQHSFSKNKDRIINQWFVQSKCSRGCGENAHPRGPKKAGSRFADSIDFNLIFHLLCVLSFGICFLARILCLYANSWNGIIYTVELGTLIVEEKFLDLFC